jgi:hypothetical protein
MGEIHEIDPSFELKKRRRLWRRIRIAGVLGPLTFLILTMAYLLFADFSKWHEAPIHVWCRLEGLWCLWVLSLVLVSWSVYLCGNSLIREATEGVRK